MFFFLSPPPFPSSFIQTVVKDGFIIKNSFSSRTDFQALNVFDVQVMRTIVQFSCIIYLAFVTIAID